MIYSHKLPNPESAKVLEGLDIAESGYWIEQLYWCWWQSFKNENKGKSSDRVMQLMTEEEKCRGCHKAVLEFMHIPCAKPLTKGCVSHL